MKADFLDTAELCLGQSDSKKCRLQRSSCNLEGWLLLEDSYLLPVALNNTAGQMLRTTGLRALSGSEYLKFALHCIPECPTFSRSRPAIALHGMQGSSDVSANVAAVILQTHLSTGGRVLMLGV